MNADIKFLLSVVAFIETILGWAGNAYAEEWGDEEVVRRYEAGEIVAVGHSEYFGVTLTLNSVTLEYHVSGGAEIWLRPSLILLRGNSQADAVMALAIGSEALRRLHDAWQSDSLS